MIEPRLFLCSGTELADGDPLRKDRRVVELDSIHPNGNVRIRIENVAKVLSHDLSPRLIDLLEIASYVFTADTATRRGQEWSDDFTTEAWSRDFQFVIPVRDLAFWQTSAVQQLLVQILNFLSNDRYNFNFCQLSEDRPTQGYLEFGGDEDWPFDGAERVLLFSGGLDSLAGALETARSEQKLVLVSHSPVSTMIKRQRELFEELRKKLPLPMIHVPVWINKQGRMAVEHTQRTRSFLYSALGTVIAESVKAGGVRFFENGIVSLNLPVADEVLQARASRTTHPLTLDLFQKLYSLVTGRDFRVDNPYLFKTKTDIVSIVLGCEGGELVPFTCSCAHTGYFQSKSQRHCGTCSQCIDRRVAILAANAESYDRDYDYVTDVFVGPRKDGQERNMAVDYARHASELDRLSEDEIATKFHAEISRAIRIFPKQSEAARDLINIHKQHGHLVFGVIANEVAKHAKGLVAGTLDKTSMLALVVGQEHLLSSWRRYSQRIITLLSNGVPVACATHKPKDEKHLQEISDGILRAHDDDLIREFPFMRWSSSLTKPDWSAEPLRLWVEAKYVRDKKDILRTTEAIAADITKYGDNDRRVLFVVYDPNHAILNEREFSKPITKRSDMLVHFLR